MVDADQFKFWADAIDLIFNNIIFLVLAYFFTLKGLNFRRLTLLGRMLALDAIVLGVLFLFGFIGQWIPWDGVWWVRVAIRGYLLFIMFRTLLVMSWTYGGWGAMHRRAWRNLKEIIKSRHIPVEYGPTDRWVD
jgi:hypothetical protein